MRQSNDFIIGNGRKGEEVMNESTKTKKALRGSLFALFLCVVLLIGTTFAWFTDTASTGVNKIQSGNLDVSLEMANGTNDKGETVWVSAENQLLTFKTADNRTADEILWEPGCTYELPQLRVVNNGNLALKYKIKINGIQGDEKLNEVIDWTINGKDINLTEQHLTAGQKGDAFTIKGHMQEAAGNDYQGLSIEGISITVVATQYTEESDSFNNTYDKNAEYDKGEVYVVDSVATLKTAAQNAKAGDEIKLMKDITVREAITFEASKITLDGNGHTITADMTDAQVENLATLLRFGHDNIYCTGVTVKNINFAGKGGRAMHFHGGTSSTLENVNISGEWSLAINFYGTHGAVMNNCDISSSYANKYCNSSIFANEQSANQIILNNTTIDSMFVNATEKGATYANDGIKVVVNSGSSIGTLHTNTGITRTFHKVNGGTIGQVLADQ